MRHHVRVHASHREQELESPLVGQVKGWQTQQIVFVGGACGSVRVESFNKNMKALGVLERKWNAIRGAHAVAGLWETLLIQ